jgi:dTMP kinase
MNEMLNSGVNVICDRYWYSGVAYSVAKGLDFNWCRSPDIGLPVPDLVIFLALDAEIASTRGITPLTEGDYGLERFEKVPLQKKVQEIFMKIKDESWFVVDASKDVEEVSLTIMSQILTVLGQ